MQSFLKTGKLGTGESSLSGQKQQQASGSKSKSSASGAQRPIPWVEKYRPKSVDDVIEQTEIVAVLKQVLFAGADLPHFLFYGPPGTGKTSTIIAACRELFGDMYRERILELNASDDRGIQVIREKVKKFAQLAAGATRPDGKPCPPYRIIILDEADSMTNAAQAALRRTMEQQTKTTRFCLICNYVSCIIQPLTSRCSKFRFRPLGEGVVRSRLEMICAAEGVKADSSALSALVSSCGGDLRHAITWLQSASRLAGTDGTISDADVASVTGTIPVERVSKFIKTCSSSSASYSDIEEYVTNLLNDAYSASQMLDQLQDVIIKNDYLSDKAKAEICYKLGICSYRLTDGANEYIQLVDLGCTMMTALKSS